MITNKNILIYFPSWGATQAIHNYIQVGQIPWDKVTTICHAFFEVDNKNMLKSIDSYLDFHKSFPHSNGLKGHFGEYKYYKNLYPNVKVLISVGGWTRGHNFHSMSLNSKNRCVFINSLIDFLKRYPFIDGIDIDWEFPGIDRKPNPKIPDDKGCPGGPEDKINYTLLLKEIREAFNLNNMSTKLLTSAVPAEYDLLFYQEPEEYNKYLDFLNVMAYNFHTTKEKVTNHHSPLYPNPNDPSPIYPIDIRNRYNSDAAMKTYRDIYKVPSYKLNLGVPLYSIGWKGVLNIDGSHPGLFAPATGPAIGTWDNPKAPNGKFPYYELRKIESVTGFLKYRDPYSMVPYLYNDISRIMFSYEDEKSLKIKCDYVIYNNYGGIFVWDISGDVINDFPMISIINDTLNQ
ncbi:glycoside hydrolase family 18 protein [Clostridium sp. YIM B02551]|uniref:glycoside hydrolase family 18 protein n=1 Tax=Clostridium sp. YIM B02551 TaxID=2910679 RepID=UPI001EEA7A18|nr:glycoside hydrolase family 18 protein [Clostridium sp. YIM B02551]